MHCFVSHILHLQSYIVYVHVYLRVEPTSINLLVSKKFIKK